MQTHPTTHTAARSGQGPVSILKVIPFVAGGLALVAMLAPAPARAVDWEVRGPGGKVVRSGRTDVPMGTSVLDLTRAALGAQTPGVLVRNIGGTLYVEALDGLPSRYELGSGSRPTRSFGWCFKLNGVLVQKSPATTLIERESDKVTWYYGFAERKNGKWSNECRQAP